MMRKLLLGDDANDEGDDFFLDDHDDENEDDQDELGDDVHKVMTFVPKDEDSYDEETATPAEAAKRKRLQKKLNKKEKNETDSKLEKKSKKADKQKKNVESDSSDRDDDQQQESTQQLELLFAGEENETVDRLKFSKNEFEKLQKTKGASKKQKKRKR